MDRLKIRLLVVSAAALVLSFPASILAQSAQPPPPPLLVAQPEEFATVRAKYEHLTPEQIAAAGYISAESPAMCISAPPGGMGFHYINREKMGRQFPSGKMDPQDPPVLLLDDNQRVIGLEWEANKNTQPPPVIFDQKVPLLPGHPGVPDDHYMFHAYFKPNGMVLFSVFDPDLKCPAARVETGPVAGMPSTGGEQPVPLPLLIGLGIVVALVGQALRRTAKPSIS